MSPEVWVSVQTSSGGPDLLTVAGYQLTVLMLMFLLEFSLGNCKMTDYRDPEKSWGFGWG